METLQKIALVFTILGAITLGLIGLLDFNLITSIAGDTGSMRNIIYIIIGITGLINIGLLFNHFHNEDEVKG